MEIVVLHIVEPRCAAPDSLWNLSLKGPICFDLGYRRQCPVHGSDVLEWPCSVGKMRHEEFPRLGGRRIGWTRI